MPTAEQFLGDKSRIFRGNGEIAIVIRDAVWQDPNLGGLENSQLADETADSGLAVTPNQVIAALLRILHVQTNAQDFQDNPDNRVTSLSVFAGRQEIGIENPQSFDTYDFTFQVRQPSAGGDLPDPDEI